MTEQVFDLVIDGGRVVTGDGDAPLTIAVRGERIEAILDPGVPVTAHRRIDATGLIVLPGGIDTHTHIEMPGTDDTFATGTRAAVLGGTTTLVDFVPAAAPGQSLLQACEARIDSVQRQAVIDVALHPIIGRCDDQAIADIGAVIGLGCTSFKMFTTYGDIMIADGDAWRLMREIAEHGGLPGFHAENHTVIGEAERRLAAQGRTGVRDFPQSRPELAEVAAIRTVCLFAKDLGTPLYIFHVSGAQGLAAIDQARDAGVEVNAETCTHYLAFDDAVFDRPDGWKYVITPPIRSAGDRDALWQGIAEGRIQAVGSDHSAYPLASKSARTDDFRAIPPGAPGVQARTPVLWNEAVNVRGLTPSQYAQISSERPARALGMFPQKGTLRVGSDADIVVLDPDAAWSGSDLAPSTPTSFDPYADYRGRGRARHVVARGTVLVDDGNLVDAGVTGRFLRRPTGG